MHCLLQILPLFSLAVACTLFGLAYSDAVLYSPAFLAACLAFTFTTVMAYWIYACQSCPTRKDLQTGVRHETPSNFWAKIKNWFSPAAKVNPVSKLQTGNRDETTPSQPGGDMEGKIVVFRQTRITEYLHVFDVEMNLPKTLYKDAGRLIAKKIGVNPSEIKRFRRIEQNETEKMPFTCWLVEIRSDSKVHADFKWLSLEDLLAISSADFAKVLRACKNKIEDPCSKLKLVIKETGARAARLQQWHENVGNDLLFAVQAKLEISDSDQASRPADPNSDDAQLPSDVNQEDDCTKEILITMIISVACTAFVMTSSFLIYKYFPVISSGWNQMSNYFISQMN
jgi:hypothetical protein